MELPRLDDTDVYNLPIGEQLVVFLDGHREMLVESLEGLDEHEVRLELVGSSTTLLGLVKHATFVERVWFEEAVSALSRTELGIEAGPDESFLLTDSDSIESVRAAFARAVSELRHVVERLGLDAVVHGNRRGPCPSGGSPFTSCGSWPSTAATPTSSVSKYSKCELPTAGSDAPVGRGLRSGSGTMSGDHARIASAPQTVRRR